MKKPFNPKAIEAMKVANTTHGLRKSRLYLTFRNLKNRCDLPTSTKYPLYGARGIKCQWKSFEDFLSDMQDCYTVHCKLHGEKNTTIDRIDVNGNYCKENCRWATMQEQQQNRRNNIYVNVNNKEMSLTEISNLLGRNYGVVYRLYKKGVLTENIKHAMS